MKIANWEHTFKDDTTFLFGAKPNKTIVEFEHLFDKQWKILDVGCGDGKNAIYLAKQGFSNVDAFDISQNAIDKVRRISETEGVRILVEFISSSYLMIISLRLRILHHSRKEWPKMEKFGNYIRGGKSSNICRIYLKRSIQMFRCIVMLQIRLWQEK